MTDTTTLTDAIAARRMTSERVDRILQDDWYPANHVVLELCRDWLDMRDRLAGYERVVSLAESAMMDWDLNGADDHFRATMDQLRAALDATNESGDA